jgi:hypothetical protein
MLKWKKALKISCENHFICKIGWIKMQKRGWAGILDRMTIFSLLSIWLLYNLSLLRYYNDEFDCITLNGRNSVLLKAGRKFCKITQSLLKKKLLTGGVFGGRTYTDITDIVQNRQKTKKLIENMISPLKYWIFKTFSTQVTFMLFFSILTCKT